MMHMYSTYLMDKLLGGTNTEDQYNFEKVKTWSNRINGGVASQDELYIPLKKNQSHWNSIQIKMKEKMIEQWDLL